MAERVRSVDMHGAIYVVAARADADAGPGVLVKAKRGMRRNTETYMYYIIMYVYQRWYM